MKYDFSNALNSPKVEEVYPPLFLDFYAELKDILHIDDTKAMNKFLNGDLCASMTAEMIKLLPPMDWASQDNIQDFIADMMDRTREKFELAYREDLVEARGDIKKMDLEALLYDLQADMAAVATCVTELVIATKDTRIEKNECVIPKATEGAREIEGRAEHVFVPVPDREEWKYAYDTVLPWLQFTSLKQVEGFLFRDDSLELSECITDEFNYLSHDQKRDLERMIDYTLVKISENQRDEYGRLCGGQVSPRHAPSSRALGTIKQNLKSEMLAAAANIAESVLAVQDQYIFPEDLKPNP